MAMQLILLGFGINFYGFFGFAVLWICGYFTWARWANSGDDLKGPADKSAGESKEDRSAGN